MAGLVDVFGKKRHDAEAGACVQIAVPMVEADAQSDQVAREQFCDFPEDDHGNLDRVLSGVGLPEQSEGFSAERGCLPLRVVNEGVGVGDEHALSRTAYDAAASAGCVPPAFG